MDPQQQSIQLAAGASPAKATPPPMLPTQRDHDERMVVGNMCPSLYRAVYKGRMAEVTALLLQQRAAAIDCQATGTVMHGQCDILEFTAERNTALHVAAEQGHHELIRELYLRYTDQGLLSRQNSALNTPMHCAARAGHARAVEVLVQVQLARDRGENILGRKNKAGDTALHLAARHGHGDTVEVLVSAAVEPAAELNNAGVSPLYLAVISGSVQAVRWIITKCKDASSAGPSAQNALHAAVFQSSEMVHLLLEWRPALADQVDSSGSSPLHFASSAGDHSIVHAILRAVPPTTVYKKDTAGLSALHVAARMGHHRVVKDMLRIYPDAAELLDGNGGTFLHTACREKQFWVVSHAIKSRRKTLRCLQLDAQDSDGNTALHLAVAAGAPYVAEDLLRKGKARADVLNNDGDTAFDLAAASTTSSFTMVRLVVTLAAYGARLRPQRQDQLTPWSGHDVVQGVQRTSDSLAVVAGLIVTSAFAAGFNVPGGYNDSNGKAYLADKFVFKTFLLLDTVAVATSVIAVILLVYGKMIGSWKSFAWALQCMWVSLMSLMLAFYVAMVAVASTTRAVTQYEQMAIYYCICILQICVSIWIVPASAWSTIWRYIRQGSHSHAVIKRQYRLAGASVFHFCLFTGTSIIGFVLFLVTFDTNGRLSTSVAPPAPSPRPI